MKKVGLLLATGLIMLVIWGCSDDQGESDTNIEWFIYKDADYHHCCNRNCGTLLEFEVQDQGASSSWYWIGLKKGGRLIHAGKGKFIANPAEVFRCTLACYHWAGFSPDHYQVHLYRCDLQAHVGNEAARTAEKDAGEVYLSLPQFSACDSCCCTGGYFYAIARRFSNNITGAKTKIVTRWPQLCGNWGLDTAHSLANVSVATPEVNGVYKYAETGYLCRYDPYMGERKSWFAAVGLGNTDVQFQFFPEAGGIPTAEEGSEHEYELEFDVQTGRWTFYYDGNHIYTDDTSGIWSSGEVGRYAIWGGEVRGHESDMPGLSANKCRLSHCEYFDGGWQGANFEEAFYTRNWIHNDDRNEWAFFQVDSTTLLLYDENPGPSPASSLSRNLAEGSLR